MRDDRASEGGQAPPGSQESGEGLSRAPTASYAAASSPPVRLSLPITSSLDPGQTFGRYRIERLLERGDMGEVYLAADQRLRRAVALRVLPPEFREDADRVERLEREARAAAALNHPNIRTVHEIGEAEGRTFIAMEYLEGVMRNTRGLARHVRRGGTS